MVRASGQDRATAAGSSIMCRPQGIAGGFVLVNVAALMVAWKSCQARPLGVGDFRTWLAFREIVARRCGLPVGREPAYGVAELARLLGVTEKRARTSVKRLAAVGLIEWSESAIVLPDHLASQNEVMGLGAIGDTIGGGRGSVAIPRRMLRFLVTGARPALIATTLGVLLRCLSRRRTGWDGRGRVKASWVARTFGISLRQAKGARRELIAVGWIAPEDSDQWSMNRFGRAFRVNLGWSPPAPSPGPTLTPPPVNPGPTLTPLDLHPEPLPGVRNQEPPRRGGPDGAWLGGEKGDRDGDQPATIATDPASVLAQQPVPVLPAPTLADVQPEDLQDTGRLLELHHQAVAKGVITGSEGDRLKFVAVAEHARSIGKGNPPGLFAYLLRGGCWRYITQDDEDRANLRIKAFLRGSAPTPAMMPEMRASMLSEDARIVKAVREATIRAGIYRDPFPAFQARHPAWDRGRWDRAMVEMGLG